MLNHSDTLNCHYKDWLRSRVYREAETSGPSVPEAPWGFSKSKLPENALSPSSSPVLHVHLNALKVPPPSPSLLPRTSSFPPRTPLPAFCSNKTNFPRHLSANTWFICLLHPTFPQRNPISDELHGERF